MDAKKVPWTRPRVRRPLSTSCVSPRWSSNKSRVSAVTHLILPMCFAPKLTELTELFGERNFSVRLSGSSHRPIHFRLPLPPSSAHRLPAIAAGIAGSAGEPRGRGCSGLRTDPPHRRRVHDRHPGKPRCHWWVKFQAGKLKLCKKDLHLLAGVAILT